MAFFDRTRTGELINRLSADTAVVGRSITDNLSDGLRAVAQAAAGVSMMVSLTLKVRAVCWQDFGDMIHHDTGVKIQYVVIYFAKRGDTFWVF